MDTFPDTDHIIIITFLFLLLTIIQILQTTYVWSVDIHIYIEILLNEEWQNKTEI